MRERERETDRDRDRDRETETERETECVCVSVVFGTLFYMYLFYILSMCLRFSIILLSLCSTSTCFI